MNNWHSLNNEKQLQDLIAASHHKPVAIFKHSTLCSISSAAKHQLETGWNEVENAADLFYLDLLAYRSVSDAIAQQFNVQHQSPQVILLNHGKVIWHASHGNITLQALQQAIV